MKERVAKLGDKVICQYRGYLPDGTQFCHSQGSAGIQLCLGERKLFPLVEDAIIGMQEGSSTKIKVPAADAYGAYDVSRLFSIALDKLPEEINAKRGVSLRLENGEGRKFDGVITSVDKKTITVDANHPLAGRDLEFELSLISIG